MTMHESSTASRCVQKLTRSAFTIMGIAALTACAYAAGVCILSVPTSPACVTVGTVVIATTGCHHSLCACNTCWDGTVYPVLCSGPTNDAGYASCAPYTYTYTVPRVIHHKTWNPYAGGCIPVGDTSASSPASSAIFSHDLTKKLEMPVFIG